MYIYIYMYTYVICIYALHTQNDIRTLYNLIWLYTTPLSLHSQAQVPKPWKRAQFLLADLVPCSVDWSHLWRIGACAGDPAADWPRNGGWDAGGFRCGWRFLGLELLVLALQDVCWNFDRVSGSLCRTLKCHWLILAAFASHISIFAGSLHAIGQ